MDNSTIVAIGFRCSFVLTVLNLLNFPIGKALDKKAVGEFSQLKKRLDLF